MRVLVIMSDAESCASYRIKQPYFNLVSDIEFKFSKNLGDAFESENKLWADAVILQRPVDTLQLKFIKEFNEAGGITIVETDDDLSNVPYSNPVHSIIKNGAGKIYRECLRHSKYIHCSTEELMMGDKSTVFHNAIDLRKYKEPLGKDDRCKVFWSGSTTHMDSLVLIKPVIEELLSNGTNVTLMSNKQWIQSIVKPHEHLSIIDYVPFDQYAKVISMASLCLVPLPDNKFNRCKSELKILESAAWKIPSVASAIAPYLRFDKISNGGCVIVKTEQKLAGVSNYANSLLRKENNKKWIHAIYGLLDNPVLYKEVAEKAYRAVETHYELSVVNKKRLEWWSRLKEQKIS